MEIKRKKSLDYLTLAALLKFYRYRINALFPAPGNRKERTLAISKKQMASTIVQHSESKNKF